MAERVLWLVLSRPTAADFCSGEWWSSPSLYHFRCLVNDRSGLGEFGDGDWGDGARLGDGEGTDTVLCEVSDVATVEELVVEGPEFVEEAVSLLSLYAAANGEFRHFPRLSLSMSQCSSASLRPRSSCLSFSRITWKANVLTSSPYKARPLIPRDSPELRLLTAPASPTGILKIF